MRLFQSKLNKILDKRDQLAAARYADQLSRATRPLPQYPSALRALKINMEG